MIIKKALEGLDGVEKATVSFEKKRGEVSYNPGKVGETDIINKVKEVGFMAKVLEEEVMQMETQAINIVVIVMKMGSFYNPILLLKKCRCL